MRNRSELIVFLEDYSPYGEEKQFVPRFLELLQHPRCYHRDHLPGHITASAWIIDMSGEYVLMTHHAKLMRWLQPGGHADGDEDVVAVATKEATEETGLKSIRLMSEKILDLDIHPIPARKDFPQHDHYDVRFLFQADMAEPFIITEESLDLKWIGLADLPHLINNNISIMRMAEKAAKSF